MPSTSIPSSPIPSPENPDASSQRSETPSPPSGLDFSQRAELVEMMDRPCSYEELRACLRDIARVNRLTFAYRPTISWMENLIAADPSAAGPLRVVDVGCGDGDMLRRIDVWAAKRGIAVVLTGIDLNPDAIRAAKEATTPAEHFEWIIGDALSNAVSGEVDVVISSLLTHHLTEPADRAVSLLDGEDCAAWMVCQRSSSSTGPVPPLSPLGALHKLASVRQIRWARVDPAQLCR